MPNANRNKGNNCERLYAKLFRELGYDKCITSRYGSRIHDDCGIDLLNVPFNVQIKAGKQRGMDYSSVLRNIGERLLELFPAEAPEFDLPNIVIHRKDVGRGKRRGEYDDLVVMSWNTYKNMIK